MENTSFDQNSCVERISKLTDNYWVPAFSVKEKQYIEDLADHNNMPDREFSEIMQVYATIEEENQNSLIVCT